MAVGDKKPVVMEADRAVPGGIATLGTDGKLSSEQIPDLEALGAIEYINSLPFTRKNLLDNWYFADPIDQRGGMICLQDTQTYSDPECTIEAGATANTVDKLQKVSTGNYQLVGLTFNAYVKAEDAVRGYVGPCYGIDRWWIGANMVLLIEGDEIVLKNTGTSFGVMHQFTCENNMLGGQCCTGSALINDQLLSFTGEVAKNPSTDTYVGASEQIDAGYIEYWSRADKKEVWHFIVNAGKEMRIKAAKLELDSTQTLAHQDENGNWVLNDPPPDKATELAKCQRYFYAFDFTDWPGVGTYWGRGINSTEIEMYNLTFPVTMRVNPALSNLKIYEDGSGSIYDVVPESYYPKKEGLRCLGVSSGMTVIEDRKYVVITAWFSADL